MLEEIIAKLCLLLGDRYGYDVDDLYYECKLTTYERERIEEIIKDASHNT